MSEERQFVVQRVLRGFMRLHDLNIQAGAVVNGLFKLATREKLTLPDLAEITQCHDALRSAILRAQAASKKDAEIEQLQAKLAETEKAAIE